MKKSGFFAYFRLPKVNFAFSLIELLISLITISVILASLAPVVTHKLKHGGISVGQGKSITNQCSAFSASCQLCTKTECLLCTLTCPDGQYFDKPTCTCKNCISNCNRCTNATACDRCKAGYQKSGNSCSACGAGYYSTEGGACQKCPKGQRSNSTSASTGCTNCTGSEYQDQEGQSSCKTCTSGFVSDSNRACTTCSAGTKWNGSSCENCPAGYYSNSANTTTCTACSSGTYQNETGKTSCKSCSGANEYQDSTGQSSCKTCGANSAPNSGHTGCNSTCQTTANCSSTQYLKDNCTCTACPSGQTPNASKTGCDTVVVNCPGVCQTCKPGTTECNTCAAGKFLNGTTCTDCMANCKSCLNSTSCRECNSGYEFNSGSCRKFKRPSSQADCDSISSSKSIYIPSDISLDNYNRDTKTSTHGTHGICVTKKNAGDLDGPDISSSVTQLNAGDKKATCAASSQKQKCCWIGHSGKTGAIRTARANTTKEDGSINTRYCTNNPNKVDHVSSAFDYDACNRTLCNYYAAEYICANYAPGTSKAGDWRLPTADEIEYIKNAVNNGPLSKTDSNKLRFQRYSGTEGLQLCQAGTSHNTAGVGSPRCNTPTKSRCYGASGDYCYPHCIWGNGDGISGCMTQSRFNKAASSFSVVSAAFSVRCVLNKTEE